MAEKLIGRSQMSRMIQLLLELRGRRYPRAADLAVACEVSRRTLYRDLEALLAAGVPVRYRADRRGYELAPGFLLPTVPLDELEAMALVLQALRPVPDGEPDLGPAARRGILKVVQALPPPLRSRIERLIAAIDAPPPGPASDAFAGLLTALATGDPVCVRGDGPDPPATLADPRLEASGATWTLVGRPAPGRRPIRIPVARIAAAELATVVPSANPADRPRMPVDSGDRAIRIRAADGDRAHSSVG